MPEPGSLLQAWKPHLKWGVVSVLVVAAIAGVALSIHPKPSRPVAPLAVGEPAQPLPTAPSDWHGKIGYKALDARFKVMMTDPSMTGLAVAVVEDGRLSFVKGYGVTASQDGRPVDSETVFRWASLSKTVSATLAARLASERLFSLSDTLGGFDTSLRLPGDAQNSLTIEQLLSQRTGLGKNAFDGRLEDGEDPATIRRSLATLHTVCPPGACHTYQNIAFDTITEVIQDRTHQPYAQTVEARLFKPLGMIGASIGQGGLTGAKSWAKPHRQGHVLPLSDAYYRLPATAGVNSTIVDLALWMQAQMGLRPDVLSPSVLSDVQRPRVATMAPYGRLPIARQLKNSGYGLGMRSFTYKGHRLIGHSGGVSGYRSTMMFDPATRTGIVMLWNSDANLPFRFQAEFFDRVYDLPFQDWLELKNGASAADPGEVS